MRTHEAITAEIAVAAATWQALEREAYNSVRPPEGYTAEQKASFRERHNARNEVEMLLQRLIAEQFKAEMGHPHTSNRDWDEVHKRYRSLTNFIPPVKPKAESNPEDTGTETEGYGRDLFHEVMRKRHRERERGFDIDF
jgi:hypothetical protein